MQEIDEVNGYICLKTFKPLKGGKADAVRCPLDKSMFEKQFKGQLCETCQLCKIGKEALGVKIFEES